MAKYILSKQAKGKKFQYTVTDESGTVISTRTSVRDYVACTRNGEFYFGRLDLIGKGSHGRALSSAMAILVNPEAAYKKQAACFIPDYRRKWLSENPFDKWVANHLDWAKASRRNWRQSHIYSNNQAGGASPRHNHLER